MATAGPPAPTGPIAGPATPEACPDEIAPYSRIRVKRARRGRLVVAGSSRDRGCMRDGRFDPGKVDRIAVSIARSVSRAHSRCAYLLVSGRLTGSRSCLRTRYLPARGAERWSLRMRVRLPRGRYKIWVRGVDRAGNVERKNRRHNFARLRVR